MDMPIEILTLSRIIAYGVPALMVLGGISLLLFGYPMDLSNAISPGWSLIIFGSLIYASELVLRQYGNR